MPTIVKLVVFGGQLTMRPLLTGWSPRVKESDGVHPKTVYEHVSPHS